MNQINILFEPDLRKYVPLDTRAIKVVAAAFDSLKNPLVKTPPILHLALDEINAEMDIKTAFDPTLDFFVVKISTGFFNNALPNLSSLNGMMVLINSKNGKPECLLVDNGYLNDLRTAAAGAVAAQKLSRETSQAVTVVGTGLQARMQVESLALVRSLKKVYIWGRSQDKAKDCANDITKNL